MKWRIECQTCQKAKCIGYGMCFPCDEDTCMYQGFENYATTQPDNLNASTTSISSTLNIHSGDKYHGI